MVNGHDHLWRESCRLSVLGSAQAYPGEAITTRQLLAHVDRQFGLKLGRRGLAIARKLNIHSRFIARDFVARGEGTRPGSGNPDLAAQAVRDALKAAALTVNDLGYLIGHTATPAQPLPPNIALVARKLGFRGPFAEFRQACTGFVNALLLARGLLANPIARPVAIVGSETGSVFFDPLRAEEDSGQLVNLVQMGDGAGAVILGPAQKASVPTITYLYHGQTGFARNSGLNMPVGGAQTPTKAGRLVPEFDHDFSGIKKHGLELLLKGLEAVQSGGMDLAQFDWVLPHQANGRIDHYLKGYLPSGVKVLVHADQVGNTGSAAIWLAFDAARRTSFPGQSILVLGAEATQYAYGGFTYVHGEPAVR